MASPNLDDLRARVAAHLAAQTGGPAEVARIELLPGGACQLNYRVKLAVPAAAGGVDVREMVLRSDAKSALPGSIDRAAEYRVIRAAAAAGVRTPKAWWLGRDFVHEGGWAYFMEWVDGEAIGRRVLRSPELAAAREQLAGELAAELAKIHSVLPAREPALFEAAPPSAAEGAPVSPRAAEGAPVSNDPAAAALLQARELIDRLPEPRPALELALRWLRERAPEPRDVVLVHGDFRTGNFMVTPRGLNAVLDWEFAHWGAPEEDLAWISVRDWRFGRLDRPVGGFALREPFYAAYERASGWPVDRARVHWWEVMGNVRWGTGSVYQGERYLSGEEQDLELVAIARRAVEMEWEALRLMGRGA